MFGIATMAITAPLFFLIILRIDALRSMFYSLLLVSLSAYFIWGMESRAVAASSVQGIYKATYIVVILFGATILVHLLQQTKAIEIINRSFQSISKDSRIYIVLIAFLFGSLIEGIAGFGTPVIIIGPLLVALGFKPMSAAVLTLIANRTSSQFGAVGTPIFVGYSNVTEASPSYFQQLSLEIIMLDFVPTLLTPLLLIYLYNRFFASERKAMRPYVMWSLFIGMGYVVFSIIYVQFLGLEFVSILTPLTMIAIAIFTIKRGIFIPKAEAIYPMNYSRHQLIGAWSPYVVIVILLGLTRLWPSVQEVVQSLLRIEHRSIFGIDPIDGDLSLFYSPGIILLLAGFIGLFIQRQPLRLYRIAIQESLRKVGKAALTLYCTLMLVQIFTNSFVNDNHLPSMPQYVADVMIGQFGGIWLLVAPLLGMLGTFITGGATISTLTFAPIQENVAIDLQLPKELILALQMTGATTGTMISINNVVTASAVLGLLGREGQVMLKTLLPAFLYIIATTASAYVLLLFFK